MLRRLAQGLAGPVPAFLSPASAAAPARQLGLCVRIYDDGVGFRYEVPEQQGYADAETTDGLTEFYLAPDASAWWISARAWNRYEFLYDKTLVTDIGLAHTPVTVRLGAAVRLQADNRAQ